MTLVTKSSAHYRLARAPDVRCGRCANMKPDGNCARVQGKVHPGYVCDLFSAKVTDMTAETARASTVPEPFGKPSGPGLWYVKGMELPAYVQHVAHDLLEAGHATTEQQAIAMAKGIIAKWANGIVPGHPGYHVHPDVRAAAVKAVAEWEQKRARAHAAHEHTGGTHVTSIDLVRTKRPLEETLANMNASEVAKRFAFASAKLGANHPLTERIGRHIASRQLGTQQRKVGVIAHIRSVHALSDTHEKQSLSNLRKLHTADHKERPHLKHTHQPGLGLGLSNEYSGGMHVTAVDLTRTKMSRGVEDAGDGTSPERQLANDYLDAEANLGSDHPHTKRLREALSGQLAGSDARKAQHVDHLRHTHRLSGKHEDKTVMDLMDQHAEDHAQNPDIHHSHPKGLEPRHRRTPVEMTHPYGAPVAFDAWGAPIDLTMTTVEYPSGTKVHHHSANGRGGTTKVGTDGKAKSRTGHYVGFEKLVQRIMAKGKTRAEAEAIAATIGRRKYGAAAFQKMAAASRRKGAA